MNQDEKTNAIKYMEIAQLAYDTTHEVMRQGEADGKSGWEEQGVCSSITHAYDHLGNLVHFAEGTRNHEEHLRYTLTRCAMAYYLWLQEQEDAE